MEVIAGKIDKPKKAVLYGPEGIGKSSLAAEFPKPIFIDTEGSTVEMDVHRLPQPSSWEMIKQQVEFAKNNIGTYETLVIDTIDWAEMYCTDAVCARYNKKGIEDFGYGQGYIYVKEEFGRFLNMLTDVIEAGMNVVLVAHSQIVKFEQPDEMGAYDRYQLKLGKKTSSHTAPLVKEWADMVLFINYKTFSVQADANGKKNKGQGGERTVHATHHPAWDAKNRQGLPDEFPLDFSYLAPIFNKKDGQQAVSQPDPQPQQPAPAPASEPQAHPAPEPQPTPEPQPVPAPTPEPTPTKQQEQQPEQPKPLDSSIPDSLRELMQQHQVTEEEIQIVVGKKGYYPMDTPIANYDANFVEGVLVGAWQQVLQMVQATREEMPFN